MIINKWNYNKSKYEPRKIPDEWYCSTYEADMKTIVNCPSCGKELEFGDTYTSREWHTAIGFGYGVCEDCYKLEIERMNIFK